MERKEERQEYIGEGIDSWNSVMLTYNAALKQMETKIAILNDEFLHVHQYNPIEYVKTRIKTPESIVKKLKRYGYETSIQNMVKYCNDIAGVRVVCSFTSDIYRLADIIGRQNDITVISIKDYMKNPKESGYKFRSGPLPWISGQVWNIKYTTSLKGMRRTISAVIFGNVRKLFPIWMPRCCI